MKSFKEIQEAYTLYKDDDWRRWSIDNPEAVSKAQSKGHKLLGIAGASNPFREWVLVGLDNFDRKFTSKVKLKPGERLYRSVSKHMGMLPLVKININKGLAYFLTDRAMSGEIDEPEFDTKGEKLRYLRILAKEDIEYENELMAEGKFAVKIADLPTFYVDGKSASQVKTGLRKKLKKPDEIEDVKLVQPAVMKKDFRDKAAGKEEVEESASVLDEGLPQPQSYISMTGKPVPKEAAVRKQVQQHNISVKYGKKGTLTTVPKGYVKNNQGMIVKEVYNKERGEKVVAGREKQNKELKPWTKKGEYRDLAKNAIKKNQASIDKHKNRLSEESIEKQVRQHNISMKYRQKGILNRPPEGYVKNNQGMYVPVSPKDWKKKRLGEDVELSEAGQLFNGEKIAFQSKQFIVTYRNTKGMAGSQDAFKMYQVKNGKLVKDLGSHPSLTGAQKFGKVRGLVEETQLEEKFVAVVNRRAAGVANTPEQAKELQKKHKGATVMKYDKWKKDYGFSRSDVEEVDRMFRNLKEELELNEKTVSVRFTPKTGVYDQMFGVISKESEFKSLKTKTEKDGVYVVTGDEQILKKMALKLRAKGYMNEGVELDEMSAVRSTFIRKAFKELASKTLTLPKLERVMEPIIDDFKEGTRASDMLVMVPRDKSEQVYKNINDWMKKNKPKNPEFEKFFDLLSFRYEETIHEGLLDKMKTKKRISDLKKQGYHVKTTAKNIKTGKLRTVMAKDGSPNVWVDESLELTEVLTKSDPIEKWIKDFIDSDAPQFEGKSKDERIKMAKGAWYAKQNEETEMKMFEKFDGDKDKDAKGSKDDKNKDGLDDVKKDQVKKDFDDREDKDIDNDGDSDKSDKYLHQRRKAISKAIAKKAK